MQRVRIGIVGAGPTTEWTILPVLSGPDILSPLDEGDWWNRRPVSATDIPYQPAARPEVVALADANLDRARRVAGIARVRAVYDDWRLMLREVPLDALLCSPDETTPDSVEILAEAGGRVRWIWLDGPPASSLEDARGLQRQAQSRPARLWCAQPLRRAAAHRAARSLITTRQIGEVTAITLRWGATLHLDTMASTSLSGSRDNIRRFASSYAALDLLLSCAAASSSSSQTAIPRQVLVSSPESDRGGAAQLWLRLANDATATALFAGADSWNNPLPRLEICGTQGRSLVCEAGRRLWLFQPRQAAHLMEPPGLAAHISTASVSGVAEDLKAFLIACADEQAPRLALESAASEYSTLWPDAARVLQLWEAACQSAKEGTLINIPPLNEQNSVRLNAVQNKADIQGSNPTLPLL